MNNSLVLVLFALSIGNWVQQAVSKFYINPMKDPERLDTDIGSSELSKWPSFVDIISQLPTAGNTPFIYRSRNIFFAEVILQHFETTFINQPFLWSFVSHQTSFHLEQSLVESWNFTLMNKIPEYFSTALIGLFCSILYLQALPNYCNSLWMG